MKRFLLLLLGLTLLFSMMQAQNDTMYIMKQGVAIGKHELSEVDSIVFYNPVSPAQSLDIENSKFITLAIATADSIDTYHKVPLIIKDATETVKINAADFYYMMARWISYFKDNGEGSTPPATITIVRGIGGPPNPSGIASGTINKTDILTKGKSNADFIVQNKCLPNFSTIGSTQYLPEAMFYAWAKTIRYYAQNSNTFPNTVTITTVSAPSTWTYDVEGISGDYPWSRTLTVPFTTQPDSHTCGPTSLKMAMDYYGVVKTVDEICNYLRLIGDDPSDGVNGVNLVLTAKYFGFTSAVAQYGVTYLKNAIASGNPVVVALQITSSYPLNYPDGTPANPTYNGGHYVVVVGLHAASDGTIDYVVVNDPSPTVGGSDHKYTWEFFDTAWQQNSSRFMICLQ